MLPSPTAKATPRSRAPRHRIRTRPAPSLAFRASVRMIGPAGLPSNADASAGRRLKRGMLGARRRNKSRRGEEHAERSRIPRNAEITRAHGIADGHNDHQPVLTLHGLARHDDAGWQVLGQNARAVGHLRGYRFRSGLLQTEQAGGEMPVTVARAREICSPSIAPPPARQSSGPLPRRRTIR